MNSDSSAVIGHAIDGLGQSSDGVLSLALFGKTAAALALVILMILALAALLRRRGQPRASQQLNLKVVGSTSLGPREKVVVVQVEDRWLVLGLAGGQITRLDSLEARNGQLPEPNVELHGSFAERFGQALKINLTGRSQGS